ncbi:hypothetical protein ACFE04_031193 [Oxalis oulophora]
MLHFSKLVKHLTFFACLYISILLPLVNCSSSSQQEPHSHKSTINTMHKGMMSPEMTSNIKVHGILLWVSMGFLMPLGILIIRISNNNKEQHSKKMIKLFFYLHLIFQTLSVLLVTAGAILSIKKFENLFNNNHQRIGLALYAAVWVQAGIGFLRPSYRESKRRVTWYLVHWILGTMITVVGIINIFTGLQAYHERTSKSTFIWTILFTLQVSFMAFFYLFQDKWDYIQKQGLIILGQQSITTIDQPNDNIATQIIITDNQKVLIPQPCLKRNALGNLFD